MRHATFGKNDHGIGGCIKGSELRLSRDAEQLSRRIADADPSERPKLYRELADIRQQQEVAGQAADAHQAEVRRVWTPEMQGMPA